MNVKKIIIYAMFTVIILITSGCSNDNIEYTKSDKKEEKGIEINEKNFPSEYVRELVSESFDSNNDNQLSQNEIDAVTELWIDPDDTYTYMDGLDNSNFKYSVIDCRGLEIFKNVEKIRICAETVEHNDEQIEKYGLLNFEKLYELDKVKELFISGEKYKAKYELNRFPNLEKVQLNYIKNLDQIKFGDKIKQIKFNSVYTDSVIDLSKVHSLERFKAIGFNCNGIVYGKNKKLKNISMQEIGKGIKEIDVSKLKNLKSLEVCYSKYLKNIKIGKIKNIDLYECKGIKELDISKCDKLKRVTVIATGIDKVRMSKTPSINHLCLSFNKIENIDLTNAKIHSLSLQGNPIKNIDVSKAKKIDKIYVKKYQNVKKGDKQQIKIIRR